MASPPRDPFPYLRASVGRPRPRSLRMRPRRGGCSSSPPLRRQHSPSPSALLLRAFAIHDLVGSTCQYVRSPHLRPSKTCGGRQEPLQTAQTGHRRRGPLLTPRVVSHRATRPISSKRGSAMEPVHLTYSSVPRGTPPAPLCRAHQCCLHLAVSTRRPREPTIARRIPVPRV